MTDVYLPLYEAKMLSFFDSRYQTYEGATSQSLPPISDELHDDPNKEPLPRYWVDEEHVLSQLDGRWDGEWLFGWRDIARSTDVRTLVPASTPRVAAGHKFPLMLLQFPSQVLALSGVLSSLACDYISRNKMAGTSMALYTMAQMACPTPEHLSLPSKWNPPSLISTEVGDRVCELTFTSWRMSSFARDMGDEGPPFRWTPERREQIRAELDAMVFHVYGLDRDEVDYVLDTFTVLRKYDERDHAEFRTKRLILEFYDLLAEAIASGVPYRTPIDPPPGLGPRHPESTRPHWMKEP